MKRGSSLIIAFFSCRTKQIKKKTKDYVDGPQNACFLWDAT